MPLDVNKVAATLMAEHGDRVQYRPFATACGIASVTDAYAVQREHVRQQMQARNTGAVGYKIGITTKAHAGHVRDRQPGRRRGSGRPRPCFRHEPAHVRLRQNRA